ncbi:MAG TPA: RNA 2',3'-cyclic phosphodiesterase [Candidatus Sulfomarinibacteraceae bacterium]|nr:RNA 2',3'-cyclic phosphodiesterase [Candidatus Sulfomarinibacteraceae bacterium]
MESIRAFIAIDLSEEARAVLANAGETLARRVPSGVVKWVSPQKMHLTLRFLGDTPLEKLDELFAALDRTVSAHPPFSLHLDELGCFPNRRRPRVVWVGVQGDTAQAEALRDDIEEMAAAMGWEPEQRPFRPHLTLGRVKEKGAALDLPWGQGVAPAKIAVDAVHLFESQLRPSGAVYTVRHTSHLQGAAG